MTERDMSNEELLQEFIEDSECSTEHGQAIRSEILRRMTKPGVECEKLAKQIAEEVALFVGYTQNVAALESMILPLLPEGCPHRFNLCADGAVRCIDCFERFTIYCAEVPAPLLPEGGTGEVRRNIETRIQFIERMKFPASQVKCEYTNRERWDLVLDELRWIQRMLRENPEPQGGKEDRPESKSDKPGLSATGASGQKAEPLASQSQEPDTSDIPEVTDWSKAVRGKFYRPQSQQPRCPKCGHPIISVNKLRVGYQAKCHYCLSEWPLPEFLFVADLARFFPASSGGQPSGESAEEFWRKWCVSFNRVWPIGQKDVLATNAIDFADAYAADLRERLAQAIAGRDYLLKDAEQDRQGLIKQLEKAEEETEALKSERDEWKERANTYRRLSIGEHWYWQGDGYDFPESITCPVIIQPDKLRELLKAGDGWIPCAERLPQIGEWCWVIWDGHVQKMAASLFGTEYGSRWQWADDEADTAPVENITYWRPLPSPPAGGQPK